MFAFPPKPHGVSISKGPSSKETEATWEDVSVCRNCIIADVNIIYKLYSDSGKHCLKGLVTHYRRGEMKEN